MLGSGTIVNVTSTAKSVSLALIGYYFASKAAFWQAAQTLRHELAGAVFASSKSSRARRIPRFAI